MILFPACSASTKVIFFIVVILPLKTSLLFFKYSAVCLQWRLFFQLNMISTIFMTSMTFTNSQLPPLQVSWKQNQVDYKKLQQQQQKMRKIGFLSYFHIMQILHYYDWIITTKKIVIVMRIYIRFKTKKNYKALPSKQASSSHISHNCYNRDSLRKRKKYICINYYDTITLLHHTYKETHWWMNVAPKSNLVVKK